MGRSNGSIISVKVPIRWDAMTEKQKIRLSRITGRDTRVIKAYLGVIERHEPDLLTGKRKNRIHAGKLDEYTLTATRGNASRVSVPHGFKARFPNLSVNEFQECRDTAIAMWKSYLERGGARPLHSKKYTTRKIPRFAFKQRFKFLYTPHQTIKHWLALRDSLDSALKGKRVHDKILIPLSVSSYHLNKMREGDLKTVRIFKDGSRKWWTIFTVTLNTDSIETNGKPPAVLSIDLGIKKAACSVLLTQKGYKQVRYWLQKDKLPQMQRYDQMIASLQRKKEDHIAQGKDPSGVTKGLRVLRSRRSNLSKEYDKKLVKDITKHIFELIQHFNLYVSIGQLRGIRNIARRGNYKGRAYRGMIHRWSFARVREMLSHKLAALGFDVKKFLAVPEHWTSIKCHKCGKKGIRPKQNLFICSCGYRANADLNGAINIGRRLIMLIPHLRDENTGLGMWLLPREKTTPKARKSSGSKRKSSLPQKPLASFEGESVADCIDQTTLVLSESGEDPAMVNTVEDPSATVKNSNHSTQMQWKEAKHQQRSNTPMMLDKAHITVSNSGLTQAADSSREKGGTHKFLCVSSVTNRRIRSYL